MRSHSDFIYDCTPRYMQVCILIASRYTGKERDTESGLDYFGARYYASNMGRFMSPDWAAKAEPVPYSKLDDPQTLNLYSYVRNNPLSASIRMAITLL
jgi:RHS repeat-associated protein